MVVEIAFGAGRREDAFLTVRQTDQISASTYFGQADGLQAGQVARFSHFCRFTKIAPATNSAYIFNQKSWVLGLAVVGRSQSQPRSNLVTSTATTTRKTPKITFSSTQCHKCSDMVSLFLFCGTRLWQWYQWLQ